MPCRGSRWPVATTSAAPRTDGRRSGDVETRQGVENGTDLRDLVGAEHPGPAEAREHREHRLGLAELVLEEIEGVRQRVADGQTQRAEAERLQQHPGLVRNAYLRLFK